MIQCIEVDLVGESYHLFYNVEAMFQLQEHFPEDALDQIGENTKPALELSFTIFKLLAEQGELARRNMGYDPRTFSELNLQVLTPADIVKLKNAIYCAITLGCERKVESLDDMDLTLLEIKKKPAEGKTAGLNS